VKYRGCSLLYILGSDPTESISPDSSSIVASRMYRIENTASQLLHCWVLRIYCLSMGIFAKPLPRNGCLCWLYSSCLEQICHNIKIQPFRRMFYEDRRFGMFDSKPKGWRRIKWRIIGWIYDVENDLRGLNMNRWRQRKKGREEFISAKRSQVSSRLADTKGTKIKCCFSCEWMRSTPGASYN
jgi:hypothetical protein